MKDNLSITARVVNGKLEFSSKYAENRYNKFLSKFPDDSMVEIFVSIHNEKASLAQIAKTHAMIRELAHDIGYTFEEMKLQIKRHAGLCIVVNRTEHCKSFADCSKQEMDMVIKTCIELGNFNGLALR
tara:strand:- start:14498 stop:14881 length:384 start_codon:yes stop_codon:yes gene_type:complete